MGGRVADIFDVPGVLVDPLEQGIHQLEGIIAPDLPHDLLVFLLSNMLTSSRLALDTVLSLDLSCINSERCFRMTDLFIVSLIWLKDGRTASVLLCIADRTLILRLLAELFRFVR